MPAISHYARPAWLLLVPSDEFCTRLKTDAESKLPLFLLIGGIVWVSVVFVGMGIIYDYENAPSNPSSSPIEWPAGSHIKRIPGQATLVMAVHPQCPCTRASLGELALLMASCQGKVSAHVIVLKPSSRDRKSVV